MQQSFPMTFLVGVWFWIPVLIILIPSTVLHLRLLMTIRNGFAHSKSLFYRLFIVQSHLELPLLYFHLLGRLLIKDQYAGRDFIISTNGSIFPTFYYYGTISFFLHVQTWGVILQSTIRFVNICAPESRMYKVIDSAPTYVWYLTNTLLPFAMMARLLFLESVSFDGNAALYTPAIVVQSNSLQGTTVTAFTAAFSAVCYAIMLRKIKTLKNKLTASKYRTEKRLTVVGFALFLAQCAMTASYLIIAFAANDNMPLVNTMRRIYILPALLLTFINPWMLTLTNRTLRKRMLCQQVKVVT